ncbi:MAG: glycosyltransferase [Reichenbachiella sp.]
MNKPLVSIICLCYNQKRFVEETLESVFNQSYNQIEVIVVDDGSTDGSKEAIERLLANRSEIPFISLDENIGNTTAFNKGLALAKGKYVVDLACDDVLVANRIEKQVIFFEGQKENVGVIYSNARYIDEMGNPLSVHFSNNKRVPYEGEVYSQLIETYFIPPPTMMIKKKVMVELKGYDESLAYEDFDFWIRSARNWHYTFQNEILTNVRKVKGSHSDRLYERKNLQLDSTVMICKKIRSLNRNSSEDLALTVRLKYEFKHAFMTGHKREAKEFYNILIEMKANSLLYKSLIVLNEFNINWSFLRTFILNLRG